RLLREYSGIPDDKIDAHVEAIRTEAFNVSPYPCIGMFQFLNLHLNTAPVYSEVLDRLKSKNKKFLDLGCCLGQEISQLVFDGAPSENMYGSDLHRGFFDVGYELFQDRDALRTTFIAADIFDSSDMSTLAALRGKMDIIYTGAFFHLWSLEEQERAATQVLRLLTPRPGSMIIGRQTGNDEAGPFSRAGDTSGRTHYRHNAESWTELWNRVGEVIGVKLVVEAELSAPEYTLSASAEGQSPEIQRKITDKGLRFVVRRA
ncbi:hypothetical protein QBC35DRAFT_546927, partial [Podospora australis]